MIRNQTLPVKTMDNQGVEIKNPLLLKFLLKEEKNYGIFIKHGRLAQLVRVLR